MKLSLVVPIYKGETFIAADIDSKYDALKKFLKAKDFEVIYIVDGSVDKAYEIAKKHIATRNYKNVSVQMRNVNKGKGYSVVEGMYYAKGEYIAYTDAGFDINLDALDNMYQLMSQDSSLTGVIANKYHEDSIYETSKIRRFLSKGYVNMTNILFGMSLKDIQTGMKMFRRSELLTVLPKLTIKKFAFEIELLTALKINGFSNLKDIPVQLKMVTKTTICFKTDILNMMKDTLAVYYRANVLEWYSDKRSFTPFQINFKTIISEVINS